MPLEGCRAKVSRAQLHFNALERSIQAFIGNGPYPIIVEPQSDKGRYLVKVQNPKPLPAEQWALMIGDCVHNIRSALDYIAWELAGSDPDDTQTMFPIYIDRNEFRRNRKRRIGRLPDWAQALIELNQPYDAPDPERSILWAIQTLDAADKHRLLTPIANAQDAVRIRTKAGPGRAFRSHVTVFSHVPLDHGAAIA